MTPETAIHVFFSELWCICECRQLPKTTKVDDYLGDMDLPSSESEEEYQAPVRTEEKKETIIMARVSSYIL